MNNKTFRYDINGLRAIAVLGVVFFHFKFDLITGGFAGVDVFFVISGFLMTKIILSSFYLDKFDLITFYLSRVKRIVPALLFLCVVLSVVSWFFLLNQPYYIQSKHILYSIFFVSNIFYWSESGYFDSGSYEKWLLHTWSLSVEWQFYLIYPIFILFICKFFKNKLNICMFIFTIILFAFTCYASSKWTDASYFLLPTRAWEMFIGGCAYVFKFNLTKEKSRLISYLGVTLVVISYFIISENVNWPGGWSLLPTLGAFLVIISSHNTNIILNNFISRTIGKLSYSIYLWHWPIIVFIYYFYQVNIHLQCIAIIITGLISVFSYVFIEKIREIRLISLSFIIILLFSTANVLERANYDFRNLSNDKRNLVLQKYQNYNDRSMDPSGMFEDCNAAMRILNTGRKIVANRCLSKSTGGILLWGDSHMGALATGIREIVPSNIPISQLTSSGCIPTLNPKENINKLKGRIERGCEYSNEEAVYYLKHYRKDTVILAMRRFHEKSGILDIINLLHGQLGVKKIIVIGPLPQWLPSLPMVYVSRHFGETYIQDAGFDSHVLEANNYLEKISSLNNNFVFVDLLNKLCKENDKGILSCRAKIGDGLMAFDYGHLTPTASKYIAKNILSSYLLN